MKNKKRDQEFSITQADGSQHWYSLTIYRNSLSRSNTLTIEGQLEDISRKKMHRLQNEKFFKIQSRFKLLSPREHEVMNLIVDGASNKQAAIKMKISTKTVKKHRHNLMKKIRVNNFAHLVRAASLVELDEK